MLVTPSTQEILIQFVKALKFQEKYIPKKFLVQILGFNLKIKNVYSHNK